MVKHTIAPHWSEKSKTMTRERVNWTAVGEELGIIPAECSNKAYILHSSQMKHGPFTAEEDILIIHSVKEWGNKGNGLWVNLQRDLSRPRTTIQKRWVGVLSKQQSL